MTLDYDAREARTAALNKLSDKARAIAELEGIDSTAAWAAALQRFPKLAAKAGRAPKEKADRGS